MPLLLDDSPVETFQSVSGFGIFQLLPWIMSQGPACMEIWSRWLRSTWQIPGVLGPGRKSQYPRRRYGDTQWNVHTTFFCDLPHVFSRPFHVENRDQPGDLAFWNTVYIIIDAPYMCIYIYIYLIYIYIYICLCVYIYIYIHIIYIYLNRHHKPVYMYMDIHNVYIYTIVLPIIFYTVGLSSVVSLARDDEDPQAGQFFVQVCGAMWWQFNARKGWFAHKE